MAESLDVASYLMRIGWRGPVKADYATLAGLLGAHITAIPFENFDVLLGRGVRLDLAALQLKLVAARRGGYCFEHATLLAAVLEAIGFKVARHAARVTVVAPRDESPRGHMFLSVAADGRRYVVDPGFGRIGSPAPLPLDGEGVPAAAPTHRVAREGALWVHFVVQEGVEKPAWVSTMEVENSIDFEMANHFIATHERSVFTRSVMASAVTAEGRVNIMNRDVTRIGRGGVTREVLADRLALRGVVAEFFGFDMEEIEMMRVPGVPEWG